MATRVVRAAQQTKALELDNPAEGGIVPNTNTSRPEGIVQKKTQELHK